MKVVAVLGSPQAQGCSSSVARRILEGAAAAGHETVIYELNRMNVRGCQGCRACKMRPTDCVVADDLRAYWQDLHTAGAVVLAAPNYFGQVCGPMLTFMNRHYCLLGPDKKPRLGPGVPLIGVFSQGSPNTEAYRPVYEAYLKLFSSFGLSAGEILICPASADRSPEGELMQRAFALGKEL